MSKSDAITAVAVFALAYLIYKGLTDAANAIGAWAGSSINPFVGLANVITPLLPEPQTFDQRKKQSEDVTKQNIIDNPTIQNRSDASGIPYVKALGVNDNLGSQGTVWWNYGTDIKPSLVPGSIPTVNLFREGEKASPVSLQTKAMEFYRTGGGPGNIVSKQIPTPQVSVNSSVPKQVSLSKPGLTDSQYRTIRGIPNDIRLSR